MVRSPLAHFAVLTALAAPAVAAPDFAIGRVGTADGDGRVPVELILINDGADARVERLPERVTVGEAALVRAADQPGEVRIAAGGFARLRYVADRAVAVAAVAAAAPPVEAAPVAVAAQAAPPPSADGDRGNAFLGNLSAYEPMYAVYGPGTNSDARLQISFKYQLFGDPGAVGAGAPLLNGVHFAYTQRLFWDLGKRSSPFRNVDYMPELMYLIPARPVAGGGIEIGAQVGMRHESNGRDGAESRSLNTLYIQPMASLMLGEDRLSIGPRLWTFVGNTSDNPDVRRYRGNSGLLVEYGRDDGFRIRADTRLNFGSGKGAINAEASYPLDRLIESPLNLYLVGQAFTGYGENLFDYNRRQTRFRIGIGIVR